MVKKRTTLLFIAVIFIITAVYAAGEKPSKTPPQGDATKQAVSDTGPVRTAKAVTFLEFGSKTCMPCKMMEPILEEIRAEYPQVQVVFHDVHTAEGNALAREYRIMSIPTQVFLDKNGKEFDRHVGFFPKAELVKVLEKGMKQ